MKHYDNSAVSPVVGVMLMLVVTIIIAALVSAFAGGSASTQTKPYQATIQGEFSISQGFTITHAGGDTLPTNDLVFTMYNGPTFGQGLKESTVQVVNLSAAYVPNDANKTPVKHAAGWNLTAFKAGDEWIIPAADTNCDIFQPMSYPYGYSGFLASDGYTYTGTRKGYWSVCFRNNDNIGKSFTLVVSDSKGKMISSSDVTIVP
jgi:archaeal type IV pilus assembly protein PilA